MVFYFTVFDMCCGYELLGTGAKTVASNTVDTIIILTNKVLVELSRPLR
jgi:hypothetical protein